jgi:hypothetical protein
MQSLTIENKIISWKSTTLALTFGLTLASIAAPMLFGHTPANQWITGTLVNACLFLSAWNLPAGNGIMIAALPSGIALTRGLLPAALAPMIPFVIAGNILLLLFARFTKKTFFLSILSAGFAKAVLLSSASLLLTTSVKPLLMMMQWPQLITALAGGFLAWTIMKIIKKA